jgi:hypothetical protein
MNILPFSQPIEDFQASLQIVMVESPFQSWHLPEVPNLFKNTIELKQSGYAHHYPNGFLPVDATDFVGIHHLICQKIKNEFIPLAGFRSITLEQCNIFHLPFPGLAGIANDPGTELHCAYVQEQLARISKNNLSVTYGSSWTVHPFARKNRAQAELLKDIARAMLFTYQTEHGIDEEIGMGVTAPKVRTDLYFSELGYEPAKYQGVLLPRFNHAEMGPESVALLHRVNFTPFAQAAGKRYRALWENRIYLHASANEISNLKKSA